MDFATLASILMILSLLFGIVLGFLLGMVAGFFVMGMVFTRHARTHRYERDRVTGKWGWRKRLGAK